MFESCVAAAFDEHLDRECLPRGVGRPPAFVRRRLLRELVLEIGVRAIDHRSIDARTSGRRRDLEDVQQVGGQIRRGASSTRPASRRSRRCLALEALELVQRRLHASRATVAASMPGSLNASPRSAASSSASARDPRCSAQPYGILDEIARAFAETDERRGRELDVQSAEASAPRPAGSVRRSAAVGFAVVRLADRRDRLRRHQHLDRDRRPGTRRSRRRASPSCGRARGQCARPGGIEPHFDRSAGRHVHRLRRGRRRTA